MTLRTTTTHSLLALPLLFVGLASGAPVEETSVEKSSKSTNAREIHVALVQFDSVPEKTEHNFRKSWDYDCRGGCVVFDAAGNVLAKANREGREEVLHYTLTFPADAKR